MLYIKKSKEQTGEHLSGKYVARVQTGIEKDGSPQYRYFTSQSDYREYLSRKREERKSGKSDEGKRGKRNTTGDKGKGDNVLSLKDKLSGKLKKEQEKGETKTRQQSRKRGDLFTGQKKAASLNKGIRLYLGDTDVK